MTDQRPDPSAPPGAGEDMDAARPPAASGDRLPPEDVRAEHDAARAAALDPAYAARERAHDEPSLADGVPDPDGARRDRTLAAAAAKAPGRDDGPARPAAVARDDEAARAPVDEAPAATFSEARARLLTTALPFGWKGMLAFGILTALGGVAAILSPFLASIAVVGIASATFVILGAATLWMAFGGDEAVVPHRVMNGAIGALMIVFGVLLFVNPVEGLLSLTILIAAFFVAEGAMRLWLGFRSRGTRDGATWLMLGGAVSIVLGVMVFLGLPATSVFVLGLFLGIDLLGTGIAMIALSVAERKATGEAPA